MPGRYLARERFVGVRAWLEQPGGAKRVLVLDQEPHAERLLKPGLHAAGVVAGNDGRDPVCGEDSAGQLGFGAAGVALQGNQ
jgi:hypothetical protein